jgi:hypothetical protein
MNAKEEFLRQMYGGRGELQSLPVDVSHWKSMADTYGLLAEGISHKPVFYYNYAQVDYGELELKVISWIEDMRRRYSVKGRKRVPCNKVNRNT